MASWKCQTAHFVSLLHAAVYNCMFVWALFYPLQDGFSHDRNADFISLSG